MRFSLPSFYCRTRGSVYGMLAKARLLPMVDVGPFSSARRFSSIPVAEDLSPTLRAALLSASPTRTPPAPHTRILQGTHFLWELIAHPCSLFPSNTRNPCRARHPHESPHPRISRPHFHGLQSHRTHHTKQDSHPYAPNRLLIAHRASIPPHFVISLPSCVSTSPSFEFQLRFDTDQKEKESVVLEKREKSRS